MAILRSPGTSRPSSSSSCSPLSSVSWSPLPGLGLDPDEIFRDLDDITIGDIPFLTGVLRRALYCTGSCLDARNLRRKYSHVLSSPPSSSSLLNLKTSSSLSSTHSRGHSHPLSTTSFPPGDRSNVSELPTSSSTSRSNLTPAAVGLATSSKREDKKASRWGGGKKEEQESMLQQGHGWERRGRDGRSFLREASAPCSCVSFYQETFASLEEDGGGACGAQLRKGDIGFRCIDCEHDSTCVVCAPCFLNGDHSSHQYMIIQASGGCCDCGDPCSWSPSGFCSKHQGVTPEMDGPASCSSLPSSLRLRAQKHISACISYITQRLRTEHRSLLHLDHNKDIFRQAIHNVVLRFSSLCRDLEEEDDSSDDSDPETLSQCGKRCRNESAEEGTSSETGHREEEGKDQQEGQTTSRSHTSHREEKNPSPERFHGTTRRKENLLMPAAEVGALTVGMTSHMGVDLAVTAGTVATLEAQRCLGVGDDASRERDRREREGEEEVADRRRARGREKEEEMRVDREARASLRRPRDEEEGKMGEKGQGTLSSGRETEEAMENVEDVREDREDKTACRNEMRRTARVDGDVTETERREEQEEDLNDDQRASRRAAELQLVSSSSSSSSSSQPSLSSSASLPGRSAFSYASTLSLFFSDRHRRSAGTSAASSQRASSPLLPEGRRDTDERSRELLSSLSTSRTPEGGVAQQARRRQQSPISSSSASVGSSSGGSHQGGEPSAGSSSSQMARRLEEEGQGGRGRRSDRSSNRDHNGGGVVIVGRRRGEREQERERLSLSQENDRRKISSSSSCLSPSRKKTSFTAMTPIFTQAVVLWLHELSKTHLGFRWMICTCLSSQSLMRWICEHSLQRKSLQLHLHDLYILLFSSPSFKEKFAHLLLQHYEQIARSETSPSSRENEEDGEEEEGQEDDDDFSEYSYDLSCLTVQLLTVPRLAVLAVWEKDFVNKAIGILKEAPSMRSTHEIEMMLNGLLYVNPKLKAPERRALQDLSYVLSEERVWRQLILQKNVKELCSILQPLWFFLFQIHRCNLQIRHSREHVVYEMIPHWHNAWILEAELLRSIKRLGIGCRSLDNKTSSLSSLAPLLSSFLPAILRLPPVPSVRYASLSPSSLSSPISFFLSAHGYALGSFHTPLPRAFILCIPPDLLRQSLLKARREMYEEVFFLSQASSSSTVSPSSSSSSSSSFAVSPLTSTPPLTLRGVAGEELDILFPSQLSLVLVREAVGSLFFAGAVRVGYWVRNGEALMIEQLREYERSRNDGADLACLQIGLLIAAHHYRKKQFLLEMKKRTKKTAEASQEETKRGKEENGGDMMERKNEDDKEGETENKQKNERGGIASSMKNDEDRQHDGVGEESHHDHHPLFLLFASFCPQYFHSKKLLPHSISQEASSPYPNRRHQRPPSPSSPFTFSSSSSSSSPNVLSSIAESLALLRGSVERTGPAGLLPLPSDDSLRMRREGEGIGSRNNGESQRRLDPSPSFPTSTSSVMVPRGRMLFPFAFLTRNLPPVSGVGRGEGVASSSSRTQQAETGRDVLTISLGGEAIGASVLGGADNRRRDEDADMSSSVSDSNSVVLRLQISPHEEEPRGGGEDKPSLTSRAEEGESLSPSIWDESRMPSGLREDRDEDVDYIKGKKISDAILSLHASLLQAASRHEEIWTPTSHRIDSQTLSEEFCLLELWKLLASCVTSVFFLERMNLHRVHAKEKYLQRYSYLLRHQIVQFLAIQPRSLQRLERAVGRSGRLHPSFMSLLEELTTYKSQRSKDKLLASSVPSIRVGPGHGGGGMTGMGYYVGGGGGDRASSSSSSSGVASSLLRLKKESWKYFDAFGISDRLIASLIPAMKRDQVSAVTPADMQVAEDEALRYPHASLLFPSRDDSSVKGTPCMSPEFFLMQDLLIDALISGDAHNTLFLLLLQLLHAKNLGPVFSRAKVTSSRKHVHSLSSASSKNGLTHPQDTGNPAASSSVSPPPPAANDSSSSSSSSSREGDRRMESDERHSDRLTSNQEANPEDSTSHAVASSSSFSKADKEGEEEKEGEDAKNSSSESSSISTSGYLHEPVCSALKLLDALVQSPGLLPCLVSSGLGMKARGEGEEEGELIVNTNEIDSIEEDRRGDFDEWMRKRERKEDEERCGVIPGRFLRPLKAAVEELRSHKDTFAEVKRYCEVLLSRIEKNTQKSKRREMTSQGSEMVGETAQERDEDAKASRLSGIAREGERRSGEAVGEEVSRVKGHQGRLFEREEKEKEDDEKKNKSMEGFLSGSVVPSPHRSTAGGDDNEARDKQQKRGEEEKRDGGGDAQKEEQRGDGETEASVKQNEGALRQRQMLLALQQRQRDFSSFLEEADMLSDSSSNKSDEDEQKKRREESRRDSRQEREGEGSSAGQGISTEREGVKISDTSFPGERREEGSVSSSTDSGLSSSSSSSSSSVHARVRCSGTQIENSSMERETPSHQGKREEEGEDQHSPSKSPSLTLPSESRPVSSSSLRTSSPSSSYLTPYSSSSSSAVVRRRGASRMMVSYVLTEEEKEMRCGVCLEGYSVANPLALLGHISQLNLLRRLCSTGKANFPASHPMFSSCGHLAHIHCIRSLQEKPGSASTTTRGHRGRGGGRRVGEGEGGGVRRRANHPSDETVTIERTALEAVAASANLRTQTDRLLSLIFGEESRGGRRSRRRNVSAELSSGGSGPDGVTGGRRRRRGEFGRSREGEDEDLVGDEDRRRRGEDEEEEEDDDERGGGGGRERRRRERRRRRRSRRTSTRRMFPGGDLEERAELRQRRGEVFVCPTCRRLGNCYLTYIPRSTLTVDGKVKQWRNEEEGERALITPYLGKTAGGGCANHHAEKGRPSVEGHSQESKEERQNSKEEENTLVETGEQEERAQSFTERRKKKRSRPGDNKRNSPEEKKEEEGEMSSTDDRSSETPGSLKERNTTIHEQEGGGCRERRKEHDAKGEKEDRLLSSSFPSKKGCCDGLCCSSSPDSLWGCCCSLNDKNETSLFAIAAGKGDEGRRDISRERTKPSGQFPASSSCSGDSLQQISLSLPPGADARILQERETEEEEEKKKGDTKRLKHTCPSSLSSIGREEKAEDAPHGDLSAGQGASGPLPVGETREKAVTSPVDGIEEAMENEAADMKGSSNELRLGVSRDRQKTTGDAFPRVAPSSVNDDVQAGEAWRKKNADDDEDRSRFTWYGVWRPSVGALVGRKRRRWRAREKSRSRSSRKTLARSGGSSNDDGPPSKQDSRFSPLSSQRTDMQQNEEDEEAKCVSFPRSMSQTHSSSEDEDEAVSDVHLLDDEDYTSSDYCITEGECVDTEVDEANEDCLFFRPEFPPGSILTSPQGAGRSSVTRGSRDLRTADPLEVFLRGVVRGEDHHRRSISAVISVTAPSHTIVNNSIARALNTPQTFLNLSTSTSSSSPPAARQSPSALALFRGLHSTRLNSGGNGDRRVASSSSSFSSAAFPRDRSPHNPPSGDGPQRSFSFSTFLSTLPSSFFHGNEQRRQYLRDQLGQSTQSPSSSDAVGMRGRDSEGYESSKRTRGRRRGEKRTEEKIRRICDECEIRHRIFRVQISKGDLKTERKQFRYQDAVDRLLNRRKNGGPFNLNFFLDNWRCFNRLGSVRWVSRPDKIRVFPEASIGGYTGSNRSASASLYASLQGSSFRRNAGELHSLGFWPCPSSDFSHGSPSSSSSSPGPHEFFNHHTLVCSPSSSSDTNGIGLSTCTSYYPSLLNEEGSTREPAGRAATPQERNEGSQMKHTRSRSRCKDCGGIKTVMTSDGVLPLGREGEKAKDFEEGEDLDEVCMCWTDAELRAWRGANAGMFMEVFEWCTYSSLLIHSHVGSRLEDPFRSRTGVREKDQEGVEGGELEDEEDDEEFRQEKKPWVQLVRNSFILDALPARCSLWLEDITKVGYWSAGNRFPRSWLELRTSPLTSEQIREEQEEREKRVLRKRLLRGALSKREWREEKERRKMKRRQEEGVDSSCSSFSLRKEGDGAMERGRRQEEEEIMEKERGVTSNSSVLNELSPSDSPSYRTPREERSNIDEDDSVGQSTRGDRDDVQPQQERETHGVDGEAASETSSGVKKKMRDASSSPSSRKDRRKNKKKKGRRERRTFDDADGDPDDEIIRSRNLEEWNWLPSPPHSCSSASSLPSLGFLSPCSHKSITTPNHKKKIVLDEDEEEELCSIPAVSEMDNIHSVARPLVHSTSTTIELSSASSFSSLSDSFSPLSSPTSSECLDVDEEMNEDTLCHLDDGKQSTSLSQPSRKEKAEDTSFASARTTVGSYSSSNSSLREREGKQSSSEEREDEGLIPAESGSAEDVVKHRCTTLDASSSHKQENSDQHGLLCLSADEDRDERRGREGRRKERRREGKKREKRSEDYMLTRDEEKNRRRLRKIQREEDLYVWQYKGRRGLSLFNPWSCDVKLEFFKAFISRVLQTPLAIRRRLSELMCIRSLQILEEFLVDECGACFSSSFPSSTTTTSSSSTSPVCPNSALTSSSSSPWAMTPSSSPLSSVSPSLSHPSYRKAFSLFYQDWLRPWELSGDLPRDLGKSVNWYGFLQIFLHCLQSQGGSLRLHSHTHQEELSSSQTVSFLPGTSCMRSKEGEQEEITKKTDLVRKNHTQDAVHSSPSSLVYLNALSPFSSSSASSLWREGNSKTSLGTSFLETGLLSQGKGESYLPPLFFSRCDESSCRQEGVKWLYTACKDILLLNGRTKSSSCSSSSSRFTSPEDSTTTERRRYLSSSEREGERLSSPHAHVDEEEEDNDDEYSYDTPSDFTSAREGRSSTPKHEHEQEKKKEMYWTPCFGAAGIAYSKGDRLHRLEKVLHDKGTLTSFWRVLAGKFPEKPSLLQLLQYTWMYCKWGDILEKEKKRREKRRESQTRGSPMYDPVKELERSSTGRKEEEVEMDVEGKDDEGSEEEGKRCHGDREKHKERGSDEDGQRLLREKIFADFEQLLVWLSNERAVSLPELFQSLVWYLMHNPFFFPYILTREKEETHAEKEKGGRCDKEKEEKMKTKEDDAKEHGNQTEKKTRGKEEREKAMEKDRQEKRESLGEDSYTVPMASPRNPSQQGDMPVERDGDTTERKKRGEDQKVYDAFISSSPGGLSWRTAKKKSRRRDAPTTVVSEQEVRVYVQQLWNRFEDRLIIGLCSFLRFSLYLVSAVWTFDTRLLQQLRKTRAAGRAQLEILLRLLGLPLHFESQAFSFHSDEDHEAKNPLHRRRGGREEEDGERFSSSSVLPLRQGTGEQERSEDERQEEGNKRRRMKRKDSFFGDTLTFLSSQAFRLHNRDSHNSSSSSSPSCSYRRRDVLLSTICRIMFGSPAVVYGALESSRRRVEMSPPCTDEVQPLQLHLPLDFLDLLRQTLLRKCPQCGELPEHKAICLLCGGTVCLGSSCCKEEDETRKKKKEASSLRISRASPGGGGVWGECMMHAQTCGGGCGVFFVVQQSMLFAIDGASWFPLESLYIEDDRHDEKAEGNVSRNRSGGGLGRLVLNQICAKRLAWLLMNGQLLPFVSRSYIRAFALSDAMSLRWP